MPDEQDEPAPIAHPQVATPAERSARPVQVDLVASGYSGPLPPPDLLAKFDDIQSGLVDGIVRMAEQQAAHRQALEAKQVDAIIADQRTGRTEARIGQVFGFLIGVVAIVAGTYAAAHNAQITGSIIGGGGVVALVSVFVLGRRRSARSDDDSDSGSSRRGRTARTETAGGA